MYSEDTALSNAYQVISNFYLLLLSDNQLFSLCRLHHKVYNILSLFIFFHFSLIFYLYYTQFLGV